MFTPGGTRVPDSPPPPTPPKAVSFGDVLISQLPTSPVAHVGPLSSFGNYSQPPHHYSQLQPPPPRPELGLPQQGSWDSWGAATPISGSPVGPPTGCFRSEEPSRLVTALPNLEVGDIPSEVSIARGDWIARIGPLMRSLSPSAPTWWSEAHAKAFGLYEQWLLSDPITRLSLKAQAIAYQANQDYLSRVEERGSVLILQSLPKELQTEAISVRALSCVALLFMIFARYQPGGGAEKATILAFLTQPQVEGTPNLQNCHLTLRKWDKMYRRCKELGLQTPDPLLLVRALDILARPLNGKPQHAFRLSTFRHSQNIDVAPHEASVLQYCEMLIAESEQALLSHPDKMQKLASLKSDGGEQPPKSQPGTPNPKAPKNNPSANTGPKTPSPKHPSGQGPLNADGVCKFFASDNGCRYGRSCEHHHNELQPSDGKCFVCGATSHAMQQCDRPKSATKASSESGKPVNPSPSKPKKPHPKPKPKPKASALQAGGEGAALASSSQGLGDTSSEIKIKAILAEAGPLPDISQRMGLLDGGATHCLRYAGPGEFASATPVDVQLAVDSTTSLRINAVGVLLSDNPSVQPLMPMGIAAKELKCKVDWDEGGCSVAHPEIGPLPITMQQECPMIPHALCMDLISELELRRGGAMLRAAHVRACLRSPTPIKGWEGNGDKFLDHLRTLVNELFPELPADLKARVVPTATHEPASSGLNRHCRRRLERGRVMIHAFSGKQAWDHPKGHPTLSIELERGRDFMSDPLFYYLLDLARRGLVDNPPCKTFSILREKGIGPGADGGPGVLRGRTGQERFRKDGLASRDQNMVDQDTVLLIRYLLLAEVAAQGLLDHSVNQDIQPQLFFLLEHPEDPAEYLFGKANEGHEHATIWEWPELKEFAKRHGLAQASFHQGVLGHSKVKPTRVMLSSGFLWERLHQLKVTSRVPWNGPSGGSLRQRIQESKTWGEWAPGLVSLIRQALEEWARGPRHEHEQACIRKMRLEHILATAGEFQVTDPVRCSKALAKPKDELFKRHCLAGHRPWRPDCAACIDAMAHIRPHRRMKFSRVCGMNIDISGPHRTAGAEDQDISKPRYFIVCAYTFPIFKTSTSEITGSTVPHEDNPINSKETASQAEPTGPPGLETTGYPTNEEEVVPQPWEVPEMPDEVADRSARDVDRIRRENEKWEALVKDCKEPNYDVLEIPLVEILPSKSSKSIISALNRFYARLRSWGLPIYRLHSDSAQELTHHSISEWASHRGIHKTASMPEQPASNGRAENLIGRLKLKARTFLRRCPEHLGLWPHAIRHACEGLQREVLHTLGHEVKPLPPFFSPVKFRARTWRDDAWGSRAAEGRLVAPSTDISKGYIIRVDDAGIYRLYASTLVYRGYLEPPSLPPIEGEGGAADPVFRTAAEVGRPVPEGSAEIMGQEGVLEPLEGPGLMAWAGSPSRESSTIPGAKAHSSGAVPGSPSRVHEATGSCGADAVNLSEGAVSSAGEVGGSAARDPQASGVGAKAKGSGPPRSLSGPSTGIREVDRDISSRERTGPDLHDIFPSLREDSGVNMRACQSTIPSGQASGRVADNLWEEGIELASLKDPRLHGLLQEWVRHLPGSRATVSSGHQRAIGAFRHGGIAGISSGLDQEYRIAQILCALIRAACPKAVFNAISISCNCRQAPHRDSNNMPGFPNHVVPLIMPAKGGHLWVEIKQGDLVQGEMVIKEVIPGKPIAGQIYKLLPGKDLSFFPNRWHSVTEFSGVRLVIVGYSVPTLGKLTSEQISQLQRAGFCEEDVSLLNAQTPPEPVQPQLPKPQQSHAHDPVSSVSQRLGADAAQKAIHVMQSQGESMPSVLGTVDEEGSVGVVGQHKENLSGPGKVSAFAVRAAKYQAAGCQVLDEDEVHPADVIALSEMRLSALGNCNGEQEDFDPARVPKGIAGLFKDAVSEDIRWFSGIPLPEIEVVDESVLKLSDEGGSDDAIKFLDGIRLAALSAVRDQETALAKELQGGASQVAESTASHLAEMYRDLSSLEQIMEGVEAWSWDTPGEGPPSPHDIALRAVSVAEPEEVLQTKIVSVAEVAANIQRWTPTLGAELESITTEHRAGTVISNEQADRLESNPDLDIVKIPGKIVATIKPGRRQKCRVVACGNFLQRPREKRSPTLDRRDIYSAGLDSISLRSQIAVAAHKRWIGATIDVKTAFLTAPYQPPRTQCKENKKRVVLVRVPRVMILAGLVPPGSWIQVEGALYGLQESPKSWGVSRDGKLKTLSWLCGGKRVSLKQCQSDVSLWLITCEAVTVGTLGVYVDDLLVMSEKGHLDAALAALQSLWQTSNPEYISQKGGLCFCGLKIEQVEDVIKIHQRTYLCELRDRYPELVPKAALPEFRGEPLDEQPCPEAIHAAQRIIGELTWVAGRTRPDIAFHVNRISRMTARYPSQALGLGKQALQYLLATIDFAICYCPTPVVPKSMLDELPVQPAPDVFQIWADASFAQADARSQTGVVITLNLQPLAWISVQCAAAVCCTVYLRKRACGFHGGYGPGPSLRTPNL